MRRNLLGNKDYPNVADSLLDLGNTQAAQVKLGKAEANIREGLALFKELTGTNSQDYANSLEKISAVCCNNKATWSKPKPNNARQ